MDKNTQHWTVFNKHWAAEHKSLSSTCLLPKYRCFCCIANNSHTALPSRPRGYVKRLTPWAASTCQRTAQSWRTCAHWCECARSRPHCASRGQRISLSYTRACYSHVLHIQCTNLTLPLFFLTGYCFWDNKLKNLKSWRIKIPSWFEELWVCDVVLKQEERCVGEWVGKTHFVRVEPWRTKVLLRSALGPVLH